MILVALSANLPSRFGSPQQTFHAALKAMEQAGITSIQPSRIWKTAPWPYNETDPWYCNAVCVVETKLGPREVLTVLLNIEKEFGRVRLEKNVSRSIDLDLIVYDNQIIRSGLELIVPHPRMQDRAFVLMPMSDVFHGDWQHPETNVTLDDMIAAIPRTKEHEATPIEGGWDE